MPNIEHDWMEEARAVAAQCWCDDETSDIEMDARLAEAFAKRLAYWMDTAAQYARNADFYRDLLDQCAEHLGPEAYDAEVTDETLTVGSEWPCPMCNGGWTGRIVDGAVRLVPDEIGSGLSSVTVKDQTEDDR